MELTILGSGGCTVIPKPCCSCPVCEEARKKGIPFARTGPSAFLHDIGLLIDTPAEIAFQLNRERVGKVDYLLFTHLDPDHVEGFRVVEQIALDFRTWNAYPDKRIRLLLPHGLREKIREIRSQYGPLIDFYSEQGYLEIVEFDEVMEVSGTRIHAVPVKRDGQTVYLYVFVNGKKRIIYAPCDIKPFPETRKEVQEPDYLLIQPGIFEEGLKHGFHYSSDHVSRTTLYTFEETVALARRIGAGRVVFVHLEEYWNRGYGDYLSIEKNFPNMRFAYDGMRLKI